MTLSEVTKALESAVSAADVKKKLADDATKAKQLADAAYGEALTIIKNLHTEYSKHMTNILTAHGQIHR